MFRSPADKTFLARMALVIPLAEVAVVSFSFVVIGEPYWLVMAITAGAATFAAIIGFSALFGPDSANFMSGGPPDEDPRERMARKREAADRMARDEKVAIWFGAIKRYWSNPPKRDADGSGHLAWTFGPLITVVLVIALLLWGGVEPAR